MYPDFKRFSENRYSVSVEIEYCGPGCSDFKSRYQELAAMIKQKLPRPEVKVSGTVGRMDAFEVRVNGTLIHSTLFSNSLPNFEEVCNIVNDCATRGAQPTQVTITEGTKCIFCNIL